MEKILMPREKLLQQGVEALNDQELLAIFLRTGIRGIPVMQLSENVLKTFGSLRGLLTASIEDFCKVKGLGKTQYIQLQATKEMTKRYLSQQMEASETISEPYMAIIFLDNQNRLIRTEKMFFGTINQASVHPREVVKAALKCNAAAIIIAHNHPSGECTPSDADRHLTKRIELACDLVDIRFVDHIIVGKGDYFSFEEEKREMF